jgi:hypothetical protein
MMELGPIQKPRLRILTITEKHVDVYPMNMNGYRETDVYVVMDDGRSYNLPEFIREGVGARFAVLLETEWFEQGTIRQVVLIDD